MKKNPIPTGPIPVHMSITDAISFLLFARRAGLTAKVTLFVPRPWQELAEGAGRDTGKGNPKINPDILKGSLVSRRSSLSKWARSQGFNRSQVSRALHGRRTDRRSREILAALEKEIGQ